MNDLLQNPVYNALLTGDASFNLGEGSVKYFDEQVSPFAGFDEKNNNGFDELYEQLPPGRKILYANPVAITEPEGWQIQVAIKGLQFVFAPKTIDATSNIQLVPLDKTHVQEMIALAALTKPGPFGARTIEFGHYYGVFDDGKLVAMTGQRLHAGEYCEVSAVCTHPEYLGRGYAAALIKQQLGIILDTGKTPFLHVRADNERAIALYERLGFRVSRNMNFYFMKRKK